MASHYENFQFLLRFTCFGTCNAVNAKFDGIGCTWNAGHVICMISSTSRGKPWTYEKRAKLALKVKLCKQRSIKHISKTFLYLIMKNIWIEKITKVLSHSIVLLVISCAETTTISQRINKVLIRQLICMFFF